MELPYIGWLSRDLVGSTSSSTFSFMIEGVVDPGSTYTVDLETGSVRPFATLEPELDPDDYVTRSEVYRGTDLGQGDSNCQVEAFFGRP